MNPKAEYLSKNDPVLQELWRVKALINKEANYNVDELMRRLRDKFPQSVKAIPQEKSLASSASA